MTRIIAVDFDGTITEDPTYRGRGVAAYALPSEHIVAWLRLQHEHGWKIVIWTCRPRSEYIDIQRYCEQWMIPFDGINTNRFAPKAVRILRARKIYADIYLDDRAIHPNDIRWDQVAQSAIDSIVEERNDE